jgi:signal transduction histidine kinase
MRSNLESRSSSLALSLALSAGQAIAGFNFSFLNILVNRVVNEDTEIIYCYIMDTNRQILAHNDSQQIGHVLEDKTSFMVAEIEKKAFLSRQTSEVNPNPILFFDANVKEGTETINVLEIVTPVYSGSALAGYLRCGYSLKEFDRSIVSLKNEWSDRMVRFRVSFMTITVFFFGLGVVTSFLFTRTFVRSIRELNAGVEKISKGNLKHRIGITGIVCSEFIHLSDSFNIMTDKLRTSYEQLEQYSRELEYKVEERTRDLKSAQANLLQRAHEAGMAEMAVGILHNIGNAITPAKVSTALLIKRINESSTRTHIKEMMARLSKILSEPTTASQEETEKLRQIVDVLPDAVIEEFDHINNEIKRIRDKHEHIESIIRLQMRYARLTGDIENVNVNKVVLDSLEMLEESITQYSIAITKDLDPDLPSIRIEQAKLLQVMINLIKNAIQAMRDTDPAERILVVSTHIDRNGEFISIAIKDSGIGFASEDKKKLFTYGYTTKREGSGFGLHSCANIIIANKGSIEATSNGPGMGAEFIVHLPLVQDAENNENVNDNEDK